MALKVSLHGYPLNEATNLLADIEMALTVADVDSEMSFEANMDGGDSPFIKITVDQESGISAIVEQYFLHHVRRKLKIAGPVTSLFFEVADFDRDGWIEVLAEHGIRY